MQIRLNAFYIKPRVIHPIEEKLLRPVPSEQQRDWQLPATQTTQCHCLIKKDKNPLNNCTEMPCSVPIKLKQYQHVNYEGSVLKYDLTAWTYDPMIHVTSIYRCPLSKLSDRQKNHSSFGVFIPEPQKQRVRNTAKVTMVSVA